MLVFSSFAKKTVGEKGCPSFLTVLWTSMDVAIVFFCQEMTRCEQPSV